MQLKTMHLKCCCCVRNEICCTSGNKSSDAWKANCAVIPETPAALYLYRLGLLSLGLYYYSLAQSLAWAQLLGIMGTYMGGHSDCNPQATC